MTDILLTAVLLLLAVLIGLVIFNRRQQNLEHIHNSLSVLDHSLNKVDQSVRDDFQRNREESGRIAKENREELTHTLKSFSETFSGDIKEFNAAQREKFDQLLKKQEDLTAKTEQRLEKMRETVEQKLQSIQADNNQKLEKMRETVDEKLHKTLETRLGESFKLVSERLEKVQQGLGEMQSLANGVGDLKKVLSNVKTRGVLGEFQLENILAQLLTPEQYVKNVKTKKDSDAFVEFAIKLPSKKDDDQPVWLPVDSKFPTETYQVLVNAYESGDAALIDSARKEIEKTLKGFARDIRYKYIDPPHTTDFALMFLPIEGLYAEVLRDTGLFETLQREFRVIITGPTTLAALLNSLQMGFRTLAIEKRSSEVWELLGAVKTEFGKFGEMLDRTRKKLTEATNVVESAGRRSRAIERKLRDVQELPAGKAGRYLDTSEDGGDDTEEHDEKP